jgi:hypothetical protein
VVRAEAALPISAMVESVLAQVVVEELEFPMLELRTNISGSPT